MQDNNLKNMVNIVGEEKKSEILLNPVGTNTKESYLPFVNPVVNNNILTPPMNGNYFPNENNAQAFEPHQGVFQQQSFDGRVQLTSENQQEMMKYACKKSIDYQVDKEEIELGTKSAMVKESYKQNLVLEKMQMAEIIRTEKENRNYAPFEDAQGFISIQTLNYNGETLMYCKLLNVKGFRCEQLCATFYDKTYCIFHVVWEGEMDGIWFREEDFNSKTLSDAAIKKGVTLLRAKSKPKEMWSLIFSYINGKKQLIFVPFVKGWNKLEDRWIFVKSNELTFSEVIKKCR